MEVSLKTDLRFPIPGQQGHRDRIIHGDIPTIGSGCYESEEQREIARLKRELRDTQDALDVLKKAISILGKDINWVLLTYQPIFAIK